MDSKDGEKMWNLLSSNDHKFYEKMVTQEKANASKNPDHIKNMGLTQEELSKYDFPKCLATRAKELLKDDVEYVLAAMES